jgi:hypothetical protein
MYLPRLQDKASVHNRQSGLWDCKRGCGQGNLFELVRRMTGWPDKQCFELLNKHGFKADGGGQVPPVKQKDIGWFTGQLRKAAPQDLQKLCNVKRIDCRALERYDPAAHRSEPIICIPVYTPSNSSPCGYLRVGKSGQLVRLKNGKREKYPAIGEHGLYGLPWLHRENPETIVLCEGWRDALAAIEAGLFATASSGGASTFKDDWLPVFSGKTVYIVMDADVPGQKAAQRAATKISRVAKQVFIVNLPYAVTENHGKDLHDYLVIDRGDIGTLLKEAKPFEPSQPSAGLGDYILIANDDADTVAEKINEYCRVRLNTIYRYNSIDGWSWYKDNRYRRIEDENELDIFIRRCIRKCLIETREKQEDGSVKVKYKPLKRKNQRFVSDVKWFWASLDGVYLAPDLHAPVSLDGQFNPAYVIPLKNGLLDFSVYPYKLHPYTPEFYTFNYLDFDWLGEHDSDLWIDFLVTATCGDAERFLLLQQWAGYTLLRSGVYQKFLMCYGMERMAKASFLTALWPYSERRTVRPCRFPNSTMSII